jgi:hypothetical protein
MTAPGAGNALASGDLTTDWGYLDGQTLTWGAFTFLGGHQPEGMYQVDSAGRLHDLVPHANGFDYKVSADGGCTWSGITVFAPNGLLD